MGVPSGVKHGWEILQPNGGVSFSHPCLISGGQGKTENKQKRKIQIKIWRWTNDLDPWWIDGSDAPAETFEQLTPMANLEI